MCLQKNVCNDIKVFHYGGLHFARKRKTAAFNVYTDLLIYHNIVGPEIHWQTIHFLGKKNHHSFLIATAFNSINLYQSLFLTDDTKHMGCLGKICTEYS